MKEILKTLTSLRLTGILLLILMIVLITASLLPYGVVSIPDSPFFALPTALFFIHLLLCSIKRLIKRQSWKSPLSSGPDIIHLAILLLITALFISEKEAVTTNFIVTENESRILPDQSLLYIERLDFFTDETGNISSWVVDVQIDNNPYSIRVNHPYRKKSINLYLTNFSTIPLVFVSDSEGSFSLQPNVRVERESESYTLRSLKWTESGWQASIDTNEEAILLIRGENSLGLFLNKIEIQNNCTLTMTRDPAFFLYPLGLFFLAGGVIFTLIYKQIRKQT